MRLYKYIVLAAALFGALSSCSIKDEESVTEGPARVIISGHVISRASRMPVSGAEVRMLRIPQLNEDGTAAMAIPQMAWTSSEGFYSFETTLAGETERYDISSGSASRSVTVSRGDQSYDAVRGCYVIELVDLFL